MSQHLETLFLSSVLVLECTPSQVPSLGNFGLIDLDTPQDALFRKSLRDGEDWMLVFSDEFNTDGRSFYPGDDPYWEAADLHYWVSLLIKNIMLQGNVSSPARRPTTWSGMTPLLSQLSMAPWLSLSPKFRLTASISKEVRFIESIKSACLKPRIHRSHLLMVIVFDFRNCDS